jgi:ABC-type branched-subunit amino acid transport system substrate-binding protein
MRQHRGLIRDFRVSGFRISGLLASLALVLVLTGCAGSGRFGSSSPQDTQNPASTTLAAPIGAVTEQPLDLPPVADAALSGAGTTATSGTTTVALLLPLGASGSTGSVAAALRNAGELAQSEYKGSKIKLVIKDDLGNAEGARSAAKAALAEGAQIVLGPLLAPSVRAAGDVARAASKPMIAFSTDQSVGGRGVYLLSFLPDNDVDQIIGYAASKGKNAFAAMIPEGAYGNVVAAAFQEACARRGLRVASVERYNPSNVDQAAKAIASITVPVDALFVPENGDGAAATSAALQVAGIENKKWQLLGTSGWDDPRLLKSQIFQNGWFATPDRTGFSAFAKRYQAKYGDEPPRLASLSYDAVFLVNALINQYGAQAFSDATLLNSDGMIGTDGLFRFKAGGGTERPLSILQVANGSTSVIQPAKQTF